MGKSTISMAIFNSYVSLPGKISVQPPKKKIHLDPLQIDGGRANRFTHLNGITYETERRATKSPKSNNHK